MRQPPGNDPNSTDEDIRAKTNQLVWYACRNNCSYSWNGGSQGVPVASEILPEMQILGPSLEPLHCKLHGQVKQSLLVSFPDDSAVLKLEDSLP